MLLHPSGEVEVLRTDPDLLLGVDPDSPRTEHTVLLQDGSTLLLFTDGLVERRGESLDNGLDRLVGVLSELVGRPLDELCDALLERLSGPAGTAGDDDVALLAVRAHPEDQPRPAEAGPEQLPPGQR